MKSNIREGVMKLLRSENRDDLKLGLSICNKEEFLSMEGRHEVRVNYKELSPNMDFNDLPVFYIICDKKVFCVDPSDFCRTTWKSIASAYATGFITVETIENSNL